MCAVGVSSGMPLANALGRGVLGTLVSRPHRQRVTKNSRSSRSVSGANGPSGAVARDPSGWMGADGAPHEPDPGAAGPPGFEEARGRRRDGIHSPGLPTRRRRWASASEGPRRSVAPWRPAASAWPRGPPAASVRVRRPFRVEGRMAKQGPAPSRSGRPHRRRGVPVGMNRSCRWTRGRPALMIDRQTKTHSESCAAPLSPKPPTRLRPAPHAGRPGTFGRCAGGGAGRRRLPSGPGVGECRREGGSRDPHAGGAGSRVPPGRPAIGCAAPFGRRSSGRRPGRGRA